MTPTKSPMTVTATNLIDLKWAAMAAAYTTHNPDRRVSMDWSRWFQAEHSPIRAVVLAVEMRGIPSFVSTHLSRHKIGVEHFVESNRDDRGGPVKVDRNTPVNHLMIVNAQALINMSRRRLCRKTHLLTKAAWLAVVAAVDEVFPELAEAMVPECQYRGRCCELKPCGGK